MQGLATAIVIISFFVGVFGLVNIVYPIKALRIRKRLIGVLILLGAVAACMGGGVLGVSTQPGGWEKAHADGEAQRKADGARAAAAAAAEPPARPVGMTEAEFLGVWSEAKRLMDPCDTRVGRAGDAMRTGDLYAAYDVVTQAQAVCEAASRDISAIPIPRSAKGDARKALIEARDRCSTAMFAKRQAMGKVARVVDGDARPSAVAEARRENELASTMTLGCVAAFAQAAEKAGYTLPELKAGEG